MKSKRSRAPRDPDERWTVVQVAAFVGCPYQTARNRMLQKRYGPSVYDATTRTLTVRASAVRRAVRASKAIAPDG